VDRDTTSSRWQLVAATVMRQPADECNRQLGRRRALPAELRAEHQRLRGVDGGVRVTGGAPRGKARLEHQMGRAAEP